MMVKTAQEPLNSVTVALWGAADIADAGKTAQRALDAVPDGWAKIGGEWVQLEPAKVTHWRVVRNATGGITNDYNSRDDGRWGITKAHEWVEQHGRSTYHVETWEQMWGSTPSVWRRVADSAEASA